MHLKNSCLVRILHHRHHHQCPRLVHTRRDHEAAVIPARKSSGVNFIYGLTCFIACFFMPKMRDFLCILVTRKSKKTDFFMHFNFAVEKKKKKIIFRDIFISLFSASTAKPRNFRTAKFSCNKVNHQIEFIPIKSW